MWLVIPRKSKYNDDMEPCCQATSLLGFLCTRPVNHEGEHEAGVFRGRVIARWRNKSPTTDKEVG